MSTNNIGIGIGALTQNGGRDNIAIGTDALKYNTSGKYNIAIGKDSGSSENTDIFDYNTYIGYQTSIDPSPLRTSTQVQGEQSSIENVENSTAIGYQAKIFEANQIVLGTASNYVYIPKQMSIGKVGASDQSRRPADGVGLDVSGSLLVSGNITGNNMIMNDISANTLFLDTRLVTNGDISGNGDLFVGGDISGNGNLFVRGNIYKNGVEINSNNFAADQVKALYSDANKNTYVGSNTTLLGGSGYQGLERSTTIGYGANIDVSNQIVLGTSGEFVCIPSNRGLSIGKKTAPASNYALDVVGSINFSGNLYQNGSIFVSGGGGGGTSNSITGDFFVSQDISCNGDLDITGDISGNGDLFVRGSVEAASYNATSDYRIKDNIRNLDEEDTISNLRPVKYLNKQTNKNDFGLIAHELQLEYPDLVSGTKDGTEYQSVNYTGLISILIKEIQDLKRITSNQTIKLESQATQLERINKLLFPND